MGLRIVGNYLWYNLPKLINRFLAKHMKNKRMSMQGSLPLDVSLCFFVYQSQCNNISANQWIVLMTRPGAPGFPLLHLPLSLSGNRRVAG